MVLSIVLCLVCTGLRNRNGRGRVVLGTMFKNGGCKERVIYRTLLEENKTLSSRSVNQSRTFM